MNRGEINSILALMKAIPSTKSMGSEIKEMFCPLLIHKRSGGDSYWGRSHFACSIFSHPQFCTPQAVRGISGSSSAWSS